jgi:hypothetical protein
MTELERRYRRLLWAFPGPYRRQHAAEIVTTLLDLAESGHGRLTAVQALHLVACGIRQRFRLPAGRPLAAIAAVLAAIAVGALGSAAGTWFGWRTAASVPSNEAMRQLTADMVGAQGGGGVSVFPWRMAMDGPVVGTTATVHSASPAERLRAALTNAGWRITTFNETASATPVDLTKDPSVTVPGTFVYFRATKDGLSLNGSSWSTAGDARYAVEAQTDQRLDVWADETPAVRPLTVTGALLGAVAGWLLAAALAYRVRNTGRSRGSVVIALVTVAFAAAVVPVFDLYRDLYQVVIYDSGAPNPYIISSSSEQLPAGLAPACTGAALLALTMALLVARRGTRTEPGPAGQEPAASS